MTPNDPRASLARMRVAAGRVAGPVRLMEVCGTHTHAIGRGGLRSLFSPNVELVSGPGCPVCVTSQRDIERMLLLARTPGLIICTFGDMLRVPGVTSSLEIIRSEGADVRVVYSVLDALETARRHPEREVAFLSVGFETTAPGMAAAILRARDEGLANFSLYVSHKLVVPAMEAVLRGGNNLQGFLTPGHVSVIIGTEAYESLAETYRMPCVACGFDPADVLEGVAMALEHIAEGRWGSFVQYVRVIRPGGNRHAWDTLMRVFEPCEAEWRGLGVIPASGLRLREPYRTMDAALRFGVPEVDVEDLPGCRCGEVLKGLIAPPDCPLFGKQCTPRKPWGPCMVSSEGACSARYKYG